MTTQFTMPIIDRTVRVLAQAWSTASLALLALLLSVNAHAQTTVEYIHTDALGSPVAITDASGNIVEREVYEPYGSPITRPASDQPGFTGHVADSLTGLTYMQQRYYDPQIGRFLSVDPVTAYSNPVGAFNRYWYANNNPYRFTDPDGRQSWDDFKKGFWDGGAAASFGEHRFPMDASFSEQAGYAVGAGAVRSGQSHGGVRIPAMRMQRPPQVRGPKTDPNAPHNATIRREGDRLVSEGNEIIAGGGRKPERLVPTPGGSKEGRRPDILYRTPEGEVKATNVGRTYADGSPVKREVQAIDDLNRAGVKTEFKSYDR